MTHSTTKEEAARVLPAVETLYKDRPWFKKVVLSNDGNGYTVDLWVDGPGYRDHLKEAASASQMIERVKVCVLMVG